MNISKKLVILVIGISLLTSGCAVFLIGAGVAGGYAISKDTMEFNSDKSFNSIWDSSAHVLDIMGTVKTKDYNKGKLEADISGTHVIVNIESITKNATRLRVSARKYMLPDMTTAQNVLNKIIQNVK